jgi:hypothetical protein
VKRWVVFSPNDGTDAGQLGGDHYEIAAKILGEV